VAAPPNPPKGIAVPVGRLARVAQFGGMAARISSGSLIDGLSQIAQGKRPTLSDVLLTPANARIVTTQLAQLRGAAMKIGQMLSMDTGDILPKELTDILAQLRAEARHMPDIQLRAVLNQNWGRGWEARLRSFDFKPIAAASIGQVHRATTLDGHELAIKVQYPGVRRSIDSDVDNVATLLRVSGLLPRALDVGPLLAEAKRQLHEEADYEREAQCLARFGALLAESPHYHVPAVHRDLTTPHVLAMEYIDSDPIETLTGADQVTRDRIVRLLIDLLFRELFEFKLMQTDPNFANYRYDPRSKRVVLLDFGATRAFPATLAEDYRRLLSSVFAGNWQAAQNDMIAIGYIDAAAPPSHQSAMTALVQSAIAPLQHAKIFDFGNTGVMNEVREEGMRLAANRDLWHIPPTDTLFIQRKLGGMYLLATRLKARVDVDALLKSYTVR
jgi:predicted unusual protein kinase regulating ubiquinone biosynthesis (AarF/ABC1/UbiB family)